MADQTQFHPMNEPYISQRYIAQRRTSNNSSGDALTPNHMMLPSYESERLLQYSQTSSMSERNQNKQMYSRSSTNIVVGESGVGRGQEVRYSNGQNNQGQEIRNSHNSSNSIQREQRVNRSINHQRQSLNNNYKANTISQQQQIEQQQALATKILHQKIHYLEKQLHQLTRLLHQQSKHSYASSLGQDYEEVAIENAQLTIQAKELEENLVKEKEMREKLEKQLIELGQEYEREHRVNNQLREKLIEMNNKTNSLERQLAQVKKQHSISTNSVSNLQEKNSYSATLQRQNTRLNEQIQTLLSKLHNLNLQINQQQSSKEQLMAQMNQQLKEIQKLRKELSDQEVEKLQLQSMNEYLKQEISYVNELATKKQKELQEKYIKEDVQRTMKRGGIQQENAQLKTHISRLEREVSQLTNEIEQQQQHIQQQQNHIDQQNNQISQLNTTILQLKRKPMTPPKQPFKQLFSQTEQTLNKQIQFLQQELNEQKDRNQQTIQKYTQIISDKQDVIDELEKENRKLMIENRTLRVELNDRRKEVDEAREECEKLEEKVEEIRSSKSLIDNSSWHAQGERVKYEEKIKLNNQMNRRLIQQKNQQIQMYTQSIRSLEQQITAQRSQLSRLARTLQLKQKQLSQKDYLVQELHQLQERHEQLIDEVKLIKKSKTSLVEEWGVKEEHIRRENQGQVERLRRLVQEKEESLIGLESKIRETINQNDHLKSQVDKLSKQLSSKQLTNQATTNHQQPPSHYIPSSPSSCPLCPQVLKQFSVYKQLMELKFQTMNQMLDELKISFIRAQFEIKDQIHKDKSKYDYWMQKYDTHDKEYRVLMERLWEWEKINAKNDMVRGIHVGQGLKMGKQQKIHKQLHHQYNKIKNNPAPHLSEIQYDLYLIKLQNSTLRSQIANLQKELSQKDRSPQNQKQIQQLKKYSENLTLQNEELKQHLNQVMMSQKKLGSTKQVTFGNWEALNGDRNSKRESLFERYSSMANINTELQERARNQEKALASAQLLINKLKKQNDNLIQTNRHLQQQLDKQVMKHRQLITQLETQRQRTHNQKRSPYQNNPNLELIDRNNIPFEYIRHHPEHKRLQQDFVGLKRSYLEMDLEFKKVKEFYQEEVQKMRIENEFHRERIKKLQEKELELMKGSLHNGVVFSFNQNSHPSNTTINHSSQLIKIKENALSVDLNALSVDLSQQTLNLAQAKVKALQQRVLYLQKQVQLKCQQCESYAHKYQELMKQLSYQPRTPRNNHLNRIEKLAEHIEVSPIQSPQWQTHSAQQQQHSDRLFLGQNNSSNTVSFDVKLLDKLKLCIDKKMIELEITPRESSNLVIKATWFIEKLANDIKELRNNVEILKGQRKAIMKERNELKEKMQNGQIYFGLKQEEQNTGSMFLKSKEKVHKHEKIVAEEQSAYGKNNKLNPHKSLSQHQNIPKLHFDSNESPIKSDSIQSNQNQLPDVIRQTLQLKNQRRSHLKKFQKQLEILTSN